jgi:hypothetical protein
MERMEHFHGATLKDGDAVVLDGLEGFLGFHVRAQGRKQWYGYFELATAQHIAAETRYRLMLKDGRIADINASAVPHSDAAQKGKHIIEFYVSGDIRGGRGRGLERSRPLG